jgi:osmotically-inducible protein OsmY
MNVITKISIIALAAVWTGVASANITSDYQLLANNDTTQEKDHSDAGITAKIKSLFVSEKLFGSADISAITIKVETHNGVVTLSGTADNQLQIDNAIRMSKSIDGVTKVNNEVTIKVK